MTKNSYTSVKTVFNSLFSSDKHQLLRELGLRLQKNGQTTLVFTPNLEQLALATREKKFAQTLGLADFLLPDGSGLVLSSRFLAHFGKATPVAKRIAGREVVLDLLELVEERSVSLKGARQDRVNVLIIGGRDYQSLVKSTPVELRSGAPSGGSSQKTVSIFYKLEPGEQFSWSTITSNSLIYWTPGFKNAGNPSPEENQAVLDLIKDLKPKLVFVALGAPHQEYWLATNKTHFSDSGVKIAMAVGGSFDVIFGKLKTPPDWVGKLGVEWLYRLWQEPRRWRRQLQLFVALSVVVRLALAREE